MILLLLVEKPQLCMKIIRINSNDFFFTERLLEKGMTYGKVVTHGQTMFAAIKTL